MKKSNSFFDLAKPAPENFSSETAFEKQIGATEDSVMFDTDASLDTAMSDLLNNSVRTQTDSSINQ